MAPVFYCIDGSFCAAHWSRYARLVYTSDSFQLHRKINSKDFCIAIWSPFSGWSVALCLLWGQKNRPSCQMRRRGAKMEGHRLPGQRATFAQWALVTLTASLSTGLFTCEIPDLIWYVDHNVGPDLYFHEGWPFIYKEYAESSRLLLVRLLSTELLILEVPTPKAMDANMY